MRTKSNGILQMTGSVLLFFFSLALLYQIYMEKTFQIYDQTLRFHVRAASDQREEQQLKIMVRDAVLASLYETVHQEENVNNLEKEIGMQLTEIRQIAEDALEESGKSRTVRVFLTKERFPIRNYGSVIFPAGEYRALRVDIGEARGHNWWCAIYPELCYNAEETMELSGKGEDDLEREISRKERNLLAGVKIKIRFKILEWISKWTGR